MHFDLSIMIRRPPGDVFAFLRDKDKYPQEPGSPVLVLEQTTPGSAGVGTRYREVVQMLPFVRGEILSVITLSESATDRFLNWHPGRRGKALVSFESRLAIKESPQPPAGPRLGAPAGLPPSVP